VFLVGHAVGVQIYVCNNTAGGYAWSLVAPRAKLYDDKDDLLATHFGGPTWQAKDSSCVVGRVENRVTVDPTAISWLRLAADAKGAGPDGDRRDDLYPADRDRRRPPACGVGVQRRDGGHCRGGAVHRRLLLLEGDRRLIRNRP